MEIFVYKRIFDMLVEKFAYGRKNAKVALKAHYSLAGTKVLWYPNYRASVSKP